MTIVRIPLTIVIQKLDDAFVHRRVKVLIAINVCQIHMDGNIKKDASYAIATTLDRLDNRVIFTLDNVYVVKDSPAVNVISVHSATSDILTVNDAAVIAMVQL